MPMGLESLVNLMKKLAASREARAALVIDFASRVARAPDHLDAGEHRFFLAAEKLSLAANPVIPASGGVPLFNPVLWLVNRPQDLPSWFALDSERIASLIVGRPDYETREAAARQLIRLFPGFKEADEAQQAEAVRRYADGTDGLTLTALSDIAQLAIRQNIGVGGVEDAVRGYKVGVTDNPWRKDYLKDKIRTARATLEDRVKGQHQACAKTVDILMRSVMGLTGAQAKSGGERPRGDTAYFSEAVLIFTSNLGIYIDDGHGNRVQNVKPDDSYEVVEARVREAIADHFKYRLGRPEILNRIGDNIIVFNFIRPDVAALILDGMLKNVTKRLAEEHQLELVIPDAIRAQLLDLCTRDLSNGGRGIGNTLESVFINPIARALFALDLEDRAQVTVTGIEEQDKVFSVTLQ